MSTGYSAASGEGDTLYAAPERRMEPGQQPLSWDYHYSPAGPRAYYSQGLPPLTHGAPMHQQQTMRPISSATASSSDSSSGPSAGGNYTWSHLQPPSVYTPQDFQHHESTPPPEPQYASMQPNTTISPQRISPAPHAAPVIVPSSRDVRTPSPPLHAGADLLDEVAAYPPHHYQPRGAQKLHMSPGRASKPNTGLSVVAPQPMPASAPLTAEPALASEDTSMRCTDFVAKLWFLLDRPEYRPHIRWNESGESFIFFPTTTFATDVLARLFKHSNVASFVRQLNLYGFQRISHLELLEDLSPSDHNNNEETDSSIPASGFSHPDFVRGRPQNLGKIRPKPSPSRARKASGKRKARTDDDEDEVSTTNTRRRRN